MLKKCASALELLKRNSASVVYLRTKIFQISAHFLLGNHLSKPTMSRFSRLQVRAESTKMEEFYPIKHPASDESRNGSRKNCGGGKEGSWLNFPL